MSLVFSIKYLLLAIILLAVEICIALFVKDRIVRPFVGDVLAVILIYCFVRIFLNANYLKIAAGVFLFSCLIEIFQYFDYVKLLGLENDRLLSVMMGRTFEALDFIAYLTGFLLVLSIEYFFSRKIIFGNL